MKFNLTTQAPDDIKTDCLIVPLITEATLSSVLNRIDAKANNSISNIKRNGDIATQPGQYILLPMSHDLPAKRLLIVNAGGNKHLSLTAFRQLMHAILQALKTTQSKNSVLLLNELSITKTDENSMLQQAILTLGAAGFFFLFSGAIFS